MIQRPVRMPLTSYSQPSSVRQAASGSPASWRITLVGFLTDISPRASQGRGRAALLVATNEATRTSGTIAAKDARWTRRRGGFVAWERPGLKTLTKLTPNLMIHTQKNDSRSLQKSSQLPESNPLREIRAERLSF